MSQEKNLLYRGDIRAAAGDGGPLLAFVALHPEGMATPLYRLNLQEMTLAEDPLPGGGVAIARRDKTLWIAGGDRRIYTAPLEKGKPKAVGPELPAPARALAPLANGRIGVMVGSEVLILDETSGKVLQTLVLAGGEVGTALAADPSGTWFAAGTERGTVAAFSAEGEQEFKPGDATKLHEGAVTALLFEPEDLRFLSAGADNRILSTLARGKLEPEDKGRGNVHGDQVAAMIWGPADRLLTGGRDKLVKSWPRVGFVKPSGIAVGTVVALAVGEIGHKPHLVVACDDNAFRLYPLDEAGRPGELSHRIYDAYAHARHELEESDFRRRQAALDQLAQIGDTVALELIATRTREAEPDPSLREHATGLLGKSSHPRAVKLLEPLLAVKDQPVRLAAFEWLRRSYGPTDLRPIDLALKANWVDLGVKAVEALEDLAKLDDQALTRLRDSINSPAFDIRARGLKALEQSGEPDSPEADLHGLTSSHVDLRRLALLRLHQRGLLGLPLVQAALRRRLEDADAEVRRTAFLLLLLGQPKLATTLREKDAELDRQLTEIEAAEKGKAAKSKGGGAGSGDELGPLLYATACRSLDVCLMGAWGLSLLGDARAFGLLMQLSREDHATARVAVCRALGALKDPRALNRLRSMLSDKDLQVRDAAFSALAVLLKADPPELIVAGLNAPFEDVRRRGLQVLLAEAKAKPPKSASEPSWGMLIGALNDAAPAVRGEACKAILGLGLAGGGAGTLRFLLQSTHADIRREVLNEAMGQANQPWSWEIILELFNDPDAKLRGDAFAFANKKGRGLEFLEAALRSRYEDLRRRGVDELVAKRTKGAQEILVGALADESKSVRLAAIEALIDAEARPALAKAMASPQADVRVRAARALARLGDPGSLAPLRALASAPEPDPGAQVDRGGLASGEEWAKSVTMALDGLGFLGDPASLTTIIPILDFKQPELRKAAARALIWVSRPDRLDALREALRHEDESVRSIAALGLAYHGDASVAPLVFSEGAAKILSGGGQLAAAFLLGGAAEDALVAMLDGDDKLGAQAFLLILALESEAPKGTLSYLLAALSSRKARIRLAAADAIREAHDPAKFRASLAARFNDRGDKPPWKIAPGVVDDFIALLFHAPSQVRARTIRLLEKLNEEKQDPWDQAWRSHAARYAKELEEARARSKGKPPALTSLKPAALDELAFGAYIGLVREQGSVGGQQASEAAGSPIVKVRQSAVSRVRAMAQGSPPFAKAALPVFIQALGDPNQEIRLAAFGHALDLGMDRTALGIEAIGVGQTDLAVKGLELLAAGGGDDSLRDVMMTRLDSVALEAAKLLVPRRGIVAVAGDGLGSANQDVRAQAIRWLSEEAEKDEQAKSRLRQALTSRYRKTREDAALALAGKKDPAAFDALAAMLKESDNPRRQVAIINAMLNLGDPRAAGVFLDRAENDPAGTAATDRLLTAAGEIRDEAVAPRLMKFLDDPKARGSAFQALRDLAGDLQPIEDADEEEADRSWEQKQRPRRDAVLASLLERAFLLGDVGLLSQLIPGARWAKSDAADGPLSPLATHPNESLRHQAVEAIGWRLWKRAGPAEPLLRALRHKDPRTQFLAAEALARVGRKEGLSVLLATLDYVDDLGLRERAVAALGRLADERALDTLIRLAGEEDHALQEAAAEAIGHMGKSSKAEEIFQLLERLANRTDDVGERAIQGLRWLGTRDAWVIIRRKAVDENAPAREKAIEMLGFDQDPATRSLLLKGLVGEEDGDTQEVFYNAARRHFGPDSLEPDYALLRNPELEYTYEAKEQALERVGKKGEPARILEVHEATRDSDVREKLTHLLINQATIPAAVLVKALGGREIETAALAARLLVRGGDAKAPGDAFESALIAWRKRWDEEQKKATAAGDDDDEDDDDNPLAKLTTGLRSLVWAAGRLGVARDELIAMAHALPTNLKYRPVRVQAVLSLGGAASADVRKALEGLVAEEDPEARAIAADLLGRAKEGAGKVAQEALSDRVAFRRLIKAQPEAGDPYLASAAGSAAQQPLALPILIARREVKRLAELAKDRKQPEAVRLGAVEGLGLIATPEAESALRAATDEKDDNDVRRAVGKAIKRAKRVRAGSKAKWTVAKREATA
jgi:ParB family chromosome partitioning protein